MTAQLLSVPEQAVALTIMTSDRTAARHFFHVFMITLSLIAGTQIYFAQFRRIIFGIFSTLDNIIHQMFHFVHQKIDFC